VVVVGVAVAVAVCLVTPAVLGSPLVSACAVCKQPLTDMDTVVTWLGGVRHHLRCPFVAPVSQAAVSRRPTLDSANVVRLARSEAKRLVQRGTLTLSGALKHDALQSMRVFDLVLLLPGVRGRGPTTIEHRVIALLTKAGVGLYRVVSELTDRQRGALVAAYAGKEAKAA
jgi:hypothetical protein